MSIEKNHFVQPTTLLTSFFLQKFTFFGFNPGLCEQPSFNFSQAQQPLSTERQQELSAEKFYKKQGSSLDKALHKVLGKLYKNSSLSDQKRWRSFFIALANGDVDKSIAEEFSERAGLSAKKYKIKEKLLKKILSAHEALQAPQSAWASCPSG